eukprot:565021-Alexandrium_andersonii.AAC.1
MEPPGLRCSFPPPRRWGHDRGGRCTSGTWGRCRSAARTCHSSCCAFDLSADHARALARALARPQLAAQLHAWFR